MGMLSDEEDDEDDEMDEDEEDEDELPAPKSKSKSKKRKHMAELDDEEDEDKDIEMDASDDDFAGQHTIDRFKDDLFASDDEADPAAELTQHEKRQASLKAQIIALEAENVAPKDWVLGGETTSRTRPKNSTLEADLDFDRTLKPTPVITEEVVHDLEERIKARILAEDFDDVVRRRVVEEKAFLPSRLIELKDTRDKEGLGKSYEDEFMAAQGGATGVDDRDGKLAKEHAELEGMWDGICAKLDALCNAHYTPKQPKTTIASISNVATPPSAPNQSSRPKRRKLLARKTASRRRKCARLWIRLRRRGR
ncbi:U3 small nucleolar ribonucleo protein complex, subunit Mpp10 [Pterulicium gracile]|uniref:U3 small nucleolar ribonucleo protein complex, subunit Mpp10 n=1 Tax=Pterulicium gracile TaxID=1884261 RepID=A0A5C3QSV0_9AGAR|nr:U3 small nucleolar ribonucleo protein complex, subunit Mpp10 [Pterula gracilis]